MASSSVWRWPDKAPLLMRRQFTDLRTVKLFEDAGHWLQQERPTEVNAALLEFLHGLPPADP